MSLIQTIECDSCNKKQPFINREGWFLITTTDFHNKDLIEHACDISCLQIVICNIDFSQIASTSIIKCNSIK